MAKTVFISHAGNDSPKAEAVSRLLAEQQISVRMDRDELRFGDSFLTFMERALSMSDYCLLLWSPNAAATPWVRTEWEAALYRSIRERRGFLVVGRLEDTPPPALLASRLLVDLFPDLAPGVHRIAATWNADRAAEAETNRPVAPAGNSNQASSGPIVYVTSELFGTTVPFSVNLSEPAGILLDRVVANLNLPNTLDHEGKIGIRFTYRLMLDNEPLSRAVPLAAQQVQDKSVLWLEATTTPFSQAAPISGELGKATFRSAGDNDESARVEAVARRLLQIAIMKSGLGS